MADPTYYLDINGLSKHFGTPAGVPSDYRYNEENIGFGITRETELDKVVKILTAGGYKNSYGDPSLYAGAGLARRFGNEYYADLGGMAGLRTGYDKAKINYKGRDYELKDPYEKITPMAAILATLGKKNFARLNMMYAPKTGGNPALLMMRLGVPFR